MTAEDLKKRFDEMMRNTTDEELIAEFEARDVIRTIEKPMKLKTIEGTIDNVGYPDYVAIGPKGELYTNMKEFVENNLEIL